MKEKSCAFVKYDSKEQALQAIRSLDKKKNLREETCLLKFFIYKVRFA